MMFLQIFDPEFLKQLPIIITAVAGLFTAIAAAFKSFKNDERIESLKKALEIERELVESLKNELKEMREANDKKELEIEEKEKEIESLRERVRHLEDQVRDLEK